MSIGPDGLIWVGNFGFSSPIGCDPPPADSVSRFLPNGQPLSPPTGLRAGPISWPQATVPDRRGNIWIANCGADSVTVFPDGRPEHAFETVIQPPTSGATEMKPFGLAIDDLGRAWVSGSRNSTLGVVGPDGDLLAVIPSTNAAGETQLTRPMGVASDSQGNIWVSNSDYMDVPCPPEEPEWGSGENPSVALFRRQPDGPALSGTTHTGGGVTIPWGNAVDGNDTLWVANFSFPFTLIPGSNDPIGPNRLSHFCGVDTAKCPPTKQMVGQAISPDGTGYVSEALARNTGVSIDPSGNVWLANNWTLRIDVLNPGGNSIAVLIGAAAPIRTPLIGPPESFDQPRHRRRPPYHWE
jgi:sugar lactone lactonase YvrE